MSSDELFGPSFSSERMVEVVSDAAWVQAMLDVEASLARAQARVGVIPDTAARDIVLHCRVDEFDIKQLGRDAVDSANPVIPLVKTLRQRVGDEAEAYVHRGATSQDILDTAMMLIARRAINVLLEDVRSAAGQAALLADRYRSTVMAGRTLLQQAAVTTFGMKASNWLVALLDARDRLFGVSKFHLLVQLGGAVGTLAALPHGVEVMRLMAMDLDLVQPRQPWHTDRAVVADLGAQVAIAAGVAGKIALDVVLLAQSEVDEVREQPKAGRGGSSAMPHKRNPVAAVEILAAVRGVNAQAGILLGSMLQEHERAAGAWQAEWPAVREIFLHAGGTTSRLALLLGSLDVDSERMRRNLELTGGLIMSERVLMKLAEKMDHRAAQALVDGAIELAMRSRVTFKESLLDDPRIKDHLTREELLQAFEPSSSVGSAETIVDSALAYYRATKSYTLEK